MTPSLPRFGLPWAIDPPLDGSLSPDDRAHVELKSLRARGHRRERLDFEMVAEPHFGERAARREAPGRS